MSPGSRSASLFSSPLLLYLDGSAHPISSLDEAGRFIRDHREHPHVAPGALLLSLLDTAQTDEMRARAWSDFATWALVAGLMRPPVRDGGT